MFLSGVQTMLKNICLHAGPSLELILLFEHLWYGSQAGCFVAFKKQNLTRSKKQRLKKTPYRENLLSSGEQPAKQSSFLRLHLRDGQCPRVSLEILTTRRHGLEENEGTCED